MFAKDMQPNGKISIMVDKLSFDSSISIIREDYILIDLIEVNEKIVNFPENIRADLIYFDENEKLFSWENVQIVPVKFKDGRKYHKINMPTEEGKKYNRRRHFRMYIGRNMRVDLKKASNSVSIMPLIKDISASGFCFIYNEPLEVGQRVVLYFDNNDNKVMSFSGKIVRIHYNENIDSNMYGCSLSDPSGVLGKAINIMQQKQINEKRR